MTRSLRFPTRQVLLEFEWQADALRKAIKDVEKAASRKIRWGSLGAAIALAKALDGSHWSTVAKMMHKRLVVSTWVAAVLHVNTKTTINLLDRPALLAFVDETVLVTQGRTHDRLSLVKRIAGRKPPRIRIPSYQDQAGDVRDYTN
jgi:hypothetical protein